MYVYIMYIIGRFIAAKNMAAPKLLPPRHGHIHFVMQKSGFGSSGLGNI